MNNLKIVNKYPVLTEVKKIEDNSILLKFSHHQYFDLEEDVYELTIFGDKISKKIDHIKEYHLNVETAVVDELNELEFFVGNIHESPDWGDWGSSFSITYESYSGKFSKKTQEDWDNELISLVSGQVKTKAFQSVTDMNFRNQKSEEIKKTIESNQIETSTRIKLNNLLEKIQELDDLKFYNVFMDGCKLD